MFLVRLPPKSPHSRAAVYVVKALRIYLVCRLSISCDSFIGVTYLDNDHWRCVILLHRILCFPTDLTQRFALELLMCRYLHISTQLSFTISVTQRTWVAETGYGHLPTCFVVIYSTNLWHYHIATWRSELNLCRLWRYSVLFMGRSA